jgi:hypothetical protein
MVEISGLHGIWVGPNHLGDTPRMTLYYPDGPTKTIEYGYGKWAECDKDAQILKDAKKEFENASLLK